MSSAGYDGVALTAPVSFGYCKDSPEDATWFLGGALRALLERSGLRGSDLNGLAVASFGLQPDCAPFLTQHFGLRLRWCEQLPFGGAAGIIAARRAARAVAAGDADIIACIAGDSTGASRFAELAGNFSRFSNEAAYPYGAAGPNLPFALITHAYMARHRVSREDFAELVLAQRHNARAFAGALLGQKPLDRATYLAARVICEPLCLLDCVLPCAGGEGFLVMSEARARSLRLPWVRLLAADERHNAHADDPVQLRGAWTEFREGLYGAAGFGPEDLHLFYSYDDYPVISLLQAEGLGLCAEGDGCRWLREHDLRYDTAGLVHNSSGGQLSCGQAGAAGGFLGLVEALRQLTGETLGNAVSGARRALVSGFGMVNYDRGVCAGAALLEAGGAT